MNYLCTESLYEKQKRRRQKMFGTRRTYWGKYAERYRAGTNLVLLAPDVAKAFANDAALPKVKSGVF